MFFVNTNKKTAVRKTIREAFDLVRQDMPGISKISLRTMSVLLERWDSYEDIFSMMASMRFYHETLPMFCDVTWIYDEGEYA